MFVRISVAVVLLGAAVTAALLWSPVGAAVVGAVGGAAAATGGALWKRSQARLVDRLDKRIGTWFTTFDRRYRAHVMASLRFVDLKGLATVGFANPELDEVYVDVGLEPKAPHLVEGGVVTTSGESARRHVTDLLDLAEPTILAVIGPPGSGKTTLLRHAARQRRRRRPVPILLTLREQVEEIKKRVQLPAMVEAALARHLPDVPRGWAEQHLRAGRCLVLLDGLDEIARAEDRRAVADWVEHQIRQFPRNDVVLTSRPQGYLEAPVTGANVVRTLPFTAAQVRTFVLGWYRAVERSHADDPTVEQRATEAAEDLLGRLGGAPALVDLTTNPLLLTMIANVHRYRGALPGSRADLYREMCQVALWRRQDAKNLNYVLPGERRESLLRALAFEMMDDGVRLVDRPALLRTLSTGLRRFATSATAEDILADACSNGLLVEREHDLFAFAHLTFQEYLASAHIRDNDLVATLATRVDDPWWRETTVLYCATARADEIVGACLRSGSVAAMGLALECADPVADLDAELRDSVAAWFSGDVSMQPEIAGVLLDQHLRTAVAIGPGLAVCLTPVPENLQVMMGRHGDEYLDFAAAEEMCRKLRTLPRSSSRTLRLPTHAEMSRVETGPLAVWCDDGRLWHSGAHPHVVGEAALKAIVADDLEKLPSPNKYVAGRPHASQIEAGIDKISTSFELSPSIGREVAWRAMARRDFDRIPTYRAIHTVLCTEVQPLVDGPAEIATRSIRLLATALAGLSESAETTETMLTLAAFAALIELRGTGQVPTESLVLVVERPLRQTERVRGTPGR
ncbi:NACHT domain-containing protein [Actinokineospora guangxiensis]|uniref:NACHT domain-containing protein n=1 Tax=Actinokineospora guangxiensis TaxID=1490288 RepID=A0ABW0EXH6_9PSEU